MGDYETVTDLATISLRPSPAEVAVDRIPELLGEVERWRAVGSVAKLPSSLADEGRSVKGLLALPLPAWTL